MQGLYKGSGRHVFDYGSCQFWIYWQLENETLLSMKIAIGSDERTHLTDRVIAELQQRGYEVLPFARQQSAAIPG